MPANYTATAQPQPQSLSASLHPAAGKLAAVASRYPGRALFATRFSPEDQLVAHLIFKNALPVRVFAYAESAPHDILMRSVDFFQGNIEVSTRQARLAAAAFAAKHPEAALAYEQRPATAPLLQLLSGHHVLISSLRKDQLPATATPPVPFEWDEANQRAIFYPLFDWTAKQVQTYLWGYDIPYLRASEVPVQKPIWANPSVWNRALQLIRPKAGNANPKPNDPIKDVFDVFRPKQAVWGF